MYVDAINESRVDKVVSKGLMIGSVHSVSAVIPMMRSVEVKPQKPNFEMKIHLTDNVPVKEPYRKVPRHMYSEANNFIDDMITNGWVRESCSSYSAPIVCARKKCGGLRLCVDYRRLNNDTILDAQLIPSIQDILDNLGGKQWLSTLDMSKAYHQGYISDEF